MRLSVFIFNCILLLSHIAAQWQAYLLSYLLLSKDGYKTGKYNFQIDLGLTDF